MRARRARPADEDSNAAERFPRPLQFGRHVDRRQRPAAASAAIWLNRPGDDFSFGVEMSIIVLVVKTILTRMCG
jgi:hypothetical protein